MALVSLALLSSCRPSTSSLAQRPLAIADLQPAALDGKPLQVVATTTLVAEVVRIVGGPDITLAMLMGPGSDPHTYEPIPRDARALAEADLVIQSGFGL